MQRIQACPRCLGTLEPTTDKRYEALASYAHKAWAGWMRYLFSLSHKTESGALIIPAHLVDRWQRQMETEYDALPEEEKASDRVEAGTILNVVQRTEL